jgi:hypothetical protein
MCHFGADAVVAGAMIEGSIPNAQPHAPSRAPQAPLIGGRGLAVLPVKPHWAQQQHQQQRGAECRAADGKAQGASDDPLEKCAPALCPRPLCGLNCTCSPGAARGHGGPTPSIAPHAALKG